MKAQDADIVSLMMAGSADEANLAQCIIQADAEFRGLDCGRTKRTTAWNKALFQLGRLLSFAKESRPHGDWLLWLERSCPNIPDRTPRKYMNEYRRMQKAMEKSQDKPLHQVTYRHTLPIYGFTRPLRRAFSCREVDSLARA